MSQLIVLAAIGGALVMLWWATARIGRQHRLKSSHFEVDYENDELRRTVTEMAKDRYRDPHRKSR